MFFQSFWSYQGDTLRLGPMCQWCVCAESLQSCLTLCNPVHGILQARILEWAAMPSSRQSSRPRDQSYISCVSCIGRQVFLPLAPPEKPPECQFSSVWLLSRVWLFATHGLQYTRPPCPSPTPRVYSNSCPSGRWCHSTISSSVIPFFARL